MCKTFDKSKDEVAKICQYFANNRQEFLAPGVKEAHVRQLLIDPLFEALGWDVRNTAQVAPQYREVITEDSLDVEGQQKAPDYCFRVGTLPKFYAEAKKCGINISADPGPAYQLRRYGWSAKVPLSILTDFEELSIYDCTIRPKQKDKAGYARTHYFLFEEYPDRWQEIWDVFSRDAVWSGAFDRHADSKRKRGTSEVDVEFLKEIESWRDTLARNIALRNEELSSDDLNYAVQRTIDRIVFLRMAEDRGIEPYEQLLKLCERSEIYPRFMKDICTKADQKYNSGLFHFQKEKGISEAPDKLTPQLTVDDKAIKPILQNLYFAHGSPYHFGVLPVEILGTVYERFLGKVIRLTAGHHAKIEEKPEVRKAGGVYYTPDYIVNYIVEHTVGSQVEGKSPAQLAEGEPFRVLDMACGSGSFLLGAYNYLLNHCLNWYIEHTPKKYIKAIYKDARKDEWRLTILEKKRILKNHIFGVDIDAQAAEVSKLSLLLKVLEGETNQTIGQQMQLFHERALPNLADNIKCGNSLIGPDYFTGRLIVDTDEMKRVNPFDWNAAFPDAMKVGGFDCIIGNPPYVRQETLGTAFKEYAQSNYSTYTSTADLYVYFIEKAHELLQPNGLFGMICSNKFMRAKYGKALRDFLANKISLLQIVDFGELPVFQKAATFPAIYLTRNKKPTKQLFLYAPIKRLDFSSLDQEVTTIGVKLDERSLQGDNWTLASPKEFAIIEKMQRKGIPLGEYIEGKMYYGIKTGLNKAFVINIETKQQLIKADPRSKEIIKPFLAGRDIKRYQQVKSKVFLILSRRGIPIEQYPAIKNYLLQYKEELAPKPKNWRGSKWSGRKSGNYKWYEIQDTIDYYDEFEKPKIIYPDIAKESRMTYDVGGSYLGNTAYIIPTNDKYLLGLLNSSLIFAYFKKTAIVLGDADKGGRLRWIKQDVSKLPIRKIDPQNPDDNNAHDRIVELVNAMLVLHDQLAAAKSSSKRDIIQRQITSTDEEINRLVYDLYDLTEDEIAIVEGDNP